jgi:hypothetical protein
MGGSKGRGLIVGRTAPIHQSCPTCGRMRIHHRAGIYQCDIPAEVTKALKAFAEANGKRWKSKLLAMWEKADYPGFSHIKSELQQARNSIGPRRLYVIDVS